MEPVIRPYLELQRLLDEYEVCEARIRQLQEARKQKMPPCICEECGKALKNKESLRKHRSSFHTGRYDERREQANKRLAKSESKKKRVQKEPPVQLPPASTPSKQKCICEVCGKAFASRSSLRNHRSCYHAPGSKERREKNRHRIALLDKKAKLENSEAAPVMPESQPEPPVQLTLEPMEPMEPMVPKEPTKEPQTTETLARVLDTNIIIKDE